MTTQVPLEVQRQLEKSMKVYACAALCSIMCALANPLSAAEEFDDEILVVGSRMPTEAYKVGRAVTVLSEVDIQNLGYKYAADLLRFVPGVAVSRSGGYGGVTQIRIRGSEANHSVVLIDGVDVSAAGTGEFDMSSLLAADIERIEVLRGPQGGLYGSNALGGVVNIVTRRPVDGMSLQSELEAGGNKTRQAAVSVAGGNSKVQGRLSFIKRQSEFDISTDDSLLGGEDDRDDNQTISGQVSASLTDQLTLQGFGRFTEKQTDTDGFDFTGGPQQGLPIDNNSFSDSEDLTLGLTATLNSLEDRSTTRMSVAHTKSELDGGTFGSESARDLVSLDSSWVWPEIVGLGQQTTAFVQYEEESFKNLFPTDISQVATQERDMLGYGLEHRLSINEELFINASLRHENNDAFKDSTTYALDVSYRLSEAGSRLHASYGSAVTNPTFFEQFGFVPGTFVGNPDLEPEESKGWDVGVEQVLFDGALLVDVTWFDVALDKEIASSFPSVINLSGESSRQGIEFSADWQPSEQTSLNINYTYTDAEEPAGIEVRRPKHMASLNVVQLLFDGRANLAIGALYNGESFDSDFRNFFTNGFIAERTETDSYTTVNVNARYAFNEAFEVYVRIENLFDADNSDQIGYALPGRTAFAGLRYSFAR
jgi:vitamin B12 transporter